MRQIWTPWRLPYILGIKAGDGCVFCDEILASEEEQELIINRGNHAFVVMNRYPYTTGHLMIVPYRHVGHLADLTTDELCEATVLLQKAERVIEEEMRTAHHHVGINIGHCAGAGVDGHIHVHLVPMRADIPIEPPERISDEPPEPLRKTRDRLVRAWSSSSD